MNSQGILNYTKNSLYRSKDCFQFLNKFPERYNQLTLLKLFINPNFGVGYNISPRRLSLLQIIIIRHDMI